jgi:hypothetical protein
MPAPPSPAKRFETNIPSMITELKSQHKRPSDLYRAISGKIEGQHPTPDELRNILKSTEEGLLEKGMSVGYFRQQVQKSPKLSSIIDDEADAIYRSEYGD